MIPNYLVSLYWLTRSFFLSSWQGLNRSKQFLSSFFYSLNHLSNVYWAQCTFLSSVRSRLIVLQMKMRFARLIESIERTIESKAVKMFSNLVTPTVVSTVGQMLTDVLGRRRERRRLSSEDYPLDRPSTNPAND
jgi:hypothetical protein